MAIVIKDRVKESSTSTGTGDFTLAGAATGFQSFASALADGDTTYYAIEGDGEWETGLGTWTESTSTLARTTIFESSNNGSAVNFSAGDKTVFITQPASRLSTISVYASAASMPTSGLSAGDLAFVTSTATLYVSNGGGWYAISAVNQTPTISGNDATYTLEKDGTATVVTLTGTDPEGFPLTWSATTSGDTSVASVTNVDNVFTITPSTNEADAGTLTVTFSASDGVNVGTASSDFTLEFQVNWQITATGTFTETSSVSTTSYQDLPRIALMDPTITYITAGGSGGNRDLHWYTLGTAGDLSTAVYQGSWAPAGLLRLSGADWNPDGTQFYLVNYTDNKIYQYSVTTPYVVGTPTQVGTYQSPDTVMMGLHIKPDGTKIWSCAFANTIVYEFTLATPFDITSVSGYQSLNIGNVGGQPTDIRWNNDGTQMIVLMQNLPDFKVFEPSTPWSFTGLTQTPAFTISANFPVEGFGFDINEDGSVWIIGSDDNVGTLRLNSVTMS